MFSRFQWLLLQLSRRVWIRVSAFSALGVATALVAILVRRYIPQDLSTQIGADAVDSLLNIIAMSMLSVTIFSLSTMVSAFGSVTSNTTPRATNLLAADTTAQNALATFLGSFLFSLVGIICLQTGLYGNTGRVVLYVVTLFVIVLIVITLLRWIDYVLRLGRVGPTSQRVEAVARAALERRQKTPYLGGMPRPDRIAVPNGGLALRPDRLGYVQHIDIEAIQETAEEEDLQVHVVLLPGHFASTTQPLCYVVGSATDGARTRIRDAFSVADTRDFDQDPRFGLCVLSEIASKALSPGINDPGTAIDLLSRGTRVIALWAQPPVIGNRMTADETPCARVHVPPVSVDDLFDDFFTPISRDGAGTVEVGIQLQKMLEVLSQLDDPRYLRAAERHSAQAMARARDALALPADLVRVERVATRIRQPKGAAD